MTSFKIKDRHTSIGKAAIWVTELKSWVGKNRYKEEHEHWTVENEQFKVLYEELLNKIEEEGAIKPSESDKASETAPIT